MNRDQINDLYAGIIYSPETQLAARERIHWICRQVQGEKVLDIGCSQGIVCLLLGREGFDCIGVDIEEQAIEYARGELEKEEDIVRQRVAFQTADAANLEFADAAFDTVILGEVLEHLTHPEKVLQEAQRVLKEAGRVIITVPLGLNSHPDHKRTFYPLSFLETVQPFFHTISIDVLNNNMIYCGKKEAHYNIANVSDKALFEEFIGVQRQTDERNLAREVQFEATTRKLYEQEKQLREQEKQLREQEKQLREQIASLSRQNASIQEISLDLKNSLNQQIALLNQQINVLNQQNLSLSRQIASLNGQNASLQTKIANLNEALKVQQASQAGALAYQEMVFQRSARWRIGSIFVGGLRLLREMILHPIRFSKEAGQRFRQYYREVMPPPWPEDEPGQSAISLDESMLAYPPLGAYDEVAAEDAPPDKEGAIPLGVIMDEFTYNCLRPEARLITFRPDNWRWILEREQPRALFVESAWHGNEGAWQYRIAKYANNMGDELLHLLDYARAKKLPSIFWNKEDPPHYERFIETARLFDFVFTSDADCIPRYLQDLPHARVHALPFAAQPEIHNPLLDEPRKHSVCFSGTYYGATFPERQKDMDLLLKPALDFGLHIYDRQHGMVGPGAEHYRFPEIYQPAIRGRLDYPEMVQAYKQYKVCLNVNSVKTSPTMFSRRVFELMACGTVVISTYSKGIEEMLGSDLVLFSEAEADTRRHLENLLGDEDYWAGLSVRGIRKVMEAHTYRHRLNTVFELCGLGTLPFHWPSFTVLAPVNDLQEIENLRSSLSRQSYRNFNVVLLLMDQLNGPHKSGIKRALAGWENRERVGQLRNHLNGVRVDAPSSYADISRYLRGDYVAIFNAQDYYGANYLKDYALAVNYGNQPEFIGKRTHYSSAGGKGELHDAGHEYLRVSRVRASTLAVRNEGLDPQQLRALLDMEWFAPAGEERQILGLDRFNYIHQAVPGPAPDNLVEKVGI